MSSICIAIRQYSNLYLRRTVAGIRFPLNQTVAVNASRRISNTGNTMEGTVIDSKLGKLRGRAATNFLGGKYYSFQGIPYAKAPVGNLRFKAPQPSEGWNGVLDATKEGPACPSSHMLFQNYMGNEDNCLNLNVYTKEMPSANASPKPVMVWIHGGAFLFESNSTEFHDPTYLMTEDVIQVIINYRLGILGFLSLEDDSLGVMGNAGLKDQVMALKWVKDNISSFGGDPNNITIYGESAGAASVHYLLLSPSTKDLFHKAIIQSGCAINPWSMGHRGTAYVTKYMGIKETNEKKILEKLQGISPKELVTAQMKIPDGFQAAFVRAFGPVVEHPSDEAFLTQEPLTILQAGTFHKVPLIIGFNSNEGMLFELSKLNGRKKPIDFEKEIPFELGVSPKTELSSLLGEKIKRFYKVDEGSEIEKLNAVHNLKSDVQFVHGINRTVFYHLQSNNSNPIYYYQFSYEGELNIWKKLLTSKYPIPYFFLQYLMNKVGIKKILGKLGDTIGFKDVPGACHADDLGYLFGTFYSPQPNQDSREEKIVRRMVGLWTNFAKYGNPTPENEKCELGVTWKPAEQQEHRYLDIADQLKMETNPFRDRMEFWDDIYGEYRKN